MTSLIDARLDIERRVIRERVTLDQLRRDRAALADQLAAEWAADPERDDAGEDERIAEADRSIPRQEAQVTGLTQALDAAERRVEDHLTEVGPRATRQDAGDRRRSHRARRRTGGRRPRGPPTRPPPPWASTRWCPARRAPGRSALAPVPSARRARSSRPAGGSITCRCPPRG